MLSIHISLVVPFLILDLLTHFELYLQTVASDPFVLLIFKFTQHFFVRLNFLIWWDNIL